MIGAFVIKCDDVVKGPNGEIQSLRCSYDPNSKGGDPADKRKINGTLHWVDATKSVPAEVRLYDRLFSVELPDAEEDFMKAMNPDSLVLAKGARVEPAVAEKPAGTLFQFVRMGYFFSDPIDSKPGKPVFNRTMTLKDTWAKAAEKVETKKPAKETAAAPQKARNEHRDALRAQTPELKERFDRFPAAHGITAEEADVLTGDIGLAKFFEAAIAHPASPKSVAKWLLNELMGRVANFGAADLKVSGGMFGKLVTLIDEGKVTTAAAKTLLAHWVEKGGDPEPLIAELGLTKVDSSEAIGAAVAKVLTQNAAEVARYRAGEKKLFGVLLGATMREIQGAADAGAVRQALTQKLG